MTISSTNRKAGPYSGNGGTVTYPFAFKVFSQSDLSVIVADLSGNESTLVITSDYTVSLNANQNVSHGGSITLLSPLESGFLMSITSELPLLQETDLTNNGGFYPTVINNALDRLTIFAQQLSEQISRALKYSITSPIGGAALPTPAANNIIGWNSDANGFANYAPVDNTLLSASLAAPGGASLIGFVQPGGVATTVQKKLREFVTFKDFGAVGNNSTDDFLACQAAITYCQSNQTHLHIGEGSYALSAQLVATGTFDITCDKTAALRWTSTSSSGILLDFTSNDDSLCQIDLPQMFSAGVNSSFEIPGYVAGSYTYTLANRYGNAIELRGGNRVTLNVHYACGWQAACLVKASSARNPENHSINFNNIDFCVYGCKADGGTSGSNGIAALVFNVNTCWAKYPIYVDGTTGYVVASKFSINGQAFINEPDGCCVYGAGTHIDTCKFFSNWTSAGKQSDSTSGVSSTLINPFIGGNQTSNGLTTDGNATIGYFGGTFCEFNIGAVMGIPGGYGASSVPAAGHTIRVRDAGSYNKVRIDNSDSVMTSPISTTTTVGEANYNGGVGGAQYSNKVYCSASVPGLPPLNGTVNHYIYHQCVSPASRKPIKVYPMDSTLAAQGLMMYATDNANSANRQIILQFANPSGTRTTGATTVNFIMELP